MIFIHSFHRLFSVLLLIASTFSLVAAENVFPNGSFEDIENHIPTGWPHGIGAAYLEEDGNHFLRLTSSGPETMDQVYLRLPVPPHATGIDFAFRMRTKEVIAGKEAWNDARIILNAIDEDETKTTLETPHFLGTTEGWEVHQIHSSLPAGTAFLEVIPCLFFASSGTFDIDDLTLSILEVAPQEFPPMTEADTPIVNGNRIVTRDGRPLLLRGINMPSLEWRVTGEHAMESMEAAIRTWKANVIRLAVNPRFWIGCGAERGEWNAQDDGGIAYRALVDQLIDYANRRGCYIVLDLHGYLAATEEHAAFWRDAATRYANRPGVLFDLLNEPYDTSWEVWRNGGTIETKDTPAKTIHAIGMQGLLNVIRETGAKNAVLCGGLDWAYDLSGVAKGYALDDPAGNGVIYSAHMYPWKGEWKDKILVAAKDFPVFIGEFGCEVKPMPWEQNVQNPYRWCPDVLAFMERHNLHWAAWCMHTDATPRAISDWNFTPTPFFGAFVRAALEGASFQSTRTR